jgi:predicted transcriptional regulator
MREKRSQVRKAILDASRKRDNCDVMTYAARIHEEPSRVYRVLKGLVNAGLYEEVPKVPGSDTHGPTFRRVRAAE